jgi:hypothetical protein
MYVKKLIIKPILGDDLELQLHECIDVFEPFDMELLKNIDEVYHESRNTYYHPGVTLAVAEVLGPVMIWSGFWATQIKCKNEFDMSLTGMPL